MSVIFQRISNVSWYRPEIDEQRLKALMQRDDLRGWIQTSAHLGLFFLTGTLAYLAFLAVGDANLWWSIPGLLIALFVHGTMGSFMGLIPVHELQHRTVFRTRRLNHIFEKIYAFISWSDYIWYERSHPIHHKATCLTAYDGEGLMAMNFRITRFTTWLCLFTFNPTTALARLNQIWNHARGKVSGDWNQFVLPESDSRIRRRHRNWARILIGGHGLLALTFVLTGHWFLIIVFNLATFYCNWLAFLCGAAQHQGLTPNVPDFRYSTRTFTCSPLVGFLYWNMQYHTEHHMYPAVPFYNLPNLREAIKRDLPPAPHGLIATWKEIFDLQRKSQTGPDYQYVPDVTHDVDPHSVPEPSRS